MALPKEQMDPMISSMDSNEFFNSISHLIGAILCLPAMAVLIVFSAMQGKPIHIISFTIYTLTLFLSFLGSVLLHFHLLFGRYVRVLGILDHCAIYLLIAGTYTPFCLVILGGWMGWTLFGIIWCLAIFNITIKAIFFTRMSNLYSVFSYVSMGWLVVIFFYFIYLRLGLIASLWIVVAGIIYTVGAISFNTGKPNPYPPYFGNHEIWHLAVFIANMIFFFVNFFYVLPYPR